MQIANFMRKKYTKKSFGFMKIIDYSNRIDLIGDIFVIMNVDNLRIIEDIRKTPTLTNRMFIIDSSIGTELT